MEKFSKAKGRDSFAALLCFGRGLFLARLAQFFLLTLRAALLALGLRHDIDRDAAVVLAAIRAGAVRDARSATVAHSRTRRHETVVAAALSRLRTIDSHSYDHSGQTIQKTRHFCNLLGSPVPP